jgi:hypothetical protein
MNIALSIQTSLCCPKHYGAVSGGEATQYKKKIKKKGFLKHGKILWDASDLK